MPNDPKQPNVVRMCGISMYSGTYSTLVALILEKIHRQSINEAWLLTYANVANLYSIKHDPTLSRLIEEDFSVLMEGVGLTIGARLVGYTATDHFNQTDFFPYVMREFEKCNVKIYCLGGHVSVIENAVKAMCELWPDIQICGHHHGYFPDEEASIVVEDIKNSDADVLLVGMGFGRQEYFCASNMCTLGVRVAWNVGGLFDFVSGNKPRAPEFIRSLHLEWLYRLSLEPRRMWRRTFIAGPWFIWQVLRQFLSAMRDRNL